MLELSIYIRPEEITLNGTDLVDLLECETEEELKELLKQLEIKFED